MHVEPLQEIDVDLCSFLESSGCLEAGRSTVDLVAESCCAHLLMCCCNSGRGRLDKSMQVDFLTTENKFKLLLLFVCLFVFGASATVRC